MTPTDQNIKVPGVLEEGNREPLQVSKESICKGMCFTINNWTIEQRAKVLIFFEEYCKNYIMGEEVGDFTKTPHLQGAFILKKKSRYSTIFNILGFKFHLEMKKGGWKSNLIYCSKGTNIVCSEPLPYKEILKTIDIKDFYDWQKNVLKIIEEDEPNDRHIYWYFDEIGGSGKSALCNYLYDNQLVSYIKSGKANDVKHFLMENKFSRDIVIDLSRANENFVSYTVMEELKDGYIFSGKYEGGCKRISIPHIFVFANFLPKEDAFSKDRIQLVNLNL